ncbi:helix-turn-helix domain-containing protein [Microbaculum marinum]|uniref:Helix-turn-helix domain-containing protein n=1 Tax=Microbaculum marinum TaxID=1764581 RepID=A0AAW9RL76_9HYPH
MGATAEEAGIAMGGGAAGNVSTSLQSEIGSDLGVTCRANSRRGVTDVSHRSYPTVESVRRALDILNVVNRLRIASLNSIHEELKLPKSTIVRLLETLMTENYVVRDNMCGGYRVTSRVRELSQGYDGIPRVIEVSRPLAISLTRRTKWPSGIGVVDGDKVSIRFWTGTISPWASEPVLGLKSDLQTSSMGRAYLAFCSDEERDSHIDRFRRDPDRGFGPVEERKFRALLMQARIDGYAMREPRTWPYRRTTVAMPIREESVVHGMITLSFFTTAVPEECVHEQIIEPLRSTTRKIDDALAFLSTGAAGLDHQVEDVDPEF